MNYKEAFYELKSLFDDVPHNGSLAPIKEVAESLAKRAEDGEKEETVSEDIQEIKDETDPFMIAAERY